MTKSWKIKKPNRLKSARNFEELLSILDEWLNGAFNLEKGGVWHVALRGGGVLRVILVIAAFFPHLLVDFGVDVDLGESESL